MEERAVDIDVIRRAQGGDETALAEIYEGMYKRVYYLAMRLTKNAEDAEDAAQETFISAFGAIGNLKDPSAFESWLFQIAANKSRNILRKNSHTVELTEDEDGKTMLDDMEDPDEELIPETAMQNAEQRRLILETIKALPQVQRECVMLFYYSGLSVKQIADDLGCSEGTVKSRLNYARAKIKESILHIEKRDGIRLHALMPIGLLLAADFEAATAGLSIPALGTAAAAAGTATAAGAAAAGAGTGSAAAGTTAAAAAAETAKVTAAVAVKTKIIAGVAAAAVVTGGGAAVYNAVVNEPEPTAIIEYMEFQDEALEYNMHLILGIPEDEGIPMDEISMSSCLSFFENGFSNDPHNGMVLQGYTDEFGNFYEDAREGVVAVYMQVDPKADEGTVPVETFSDLPSFGSKSLLLRFYGDAVRPDITQLKALFPNAYIDFHDVDADGKVNLAIIHKNPEVVEFADPIMEQNVRLLMGLHEGEPVYTLQLESVNSVLLSSDGMNMLDIGPMTWHNDGIVPVPGTKAISDYSDLKYFGDGRELYVICRSKGDIDEKALLEAVPYAQLRYLDGTGEYPLGYEPLVFGDKNFEKNLRIILGVEDGWPMTKELLDRIVFLYIYPDGMNAVVREAVTGQIQGNETAQLGPLEGTAAVTDFSDLPLLLGSQKHIITKEQNPFTQEMLNEIFPGWNILLEGMGNECFFELPYTG